MHVSELIYPEGAIAPSAHAATLAELPDGDLYAAWYAGSRERGRDVAVWGARWSRASGAWQPPAIIANTPHLAEGNPVLFQEPGGALRLFFATIHGREWTDAVLKEQRSSDGGTTWDPVRMLPSPPGWLIRNKLLVLRTGEWLLPLYDELEWTAMFWITADRGETWHRHGRVEGPDGVIQPSVVYRGDGSLLAILRTGGPGGWLWKSVSRDEGRTWSDAEPMPLPNPNSAADAVRLGSGNLLLAFNNSSRERTPLTLGLSRDDGETWPLLRDVEAGPGEYSYPALIQASDGSIHLLYTYRRRSIKHVVLTEEWLASLD